MFYWKLKCWHNSVDFQERWYLAHTRSTNQPMCAVMWPAFSTLFQQQKRLGSLFKGIQLNVQHCATPIDRVVNRRKWTGIKQVQTILTHIVGRSSWRCHAQQMKKHWVKYFGVQHGKTAEYNREYRNSFHCCHLHLVCLLYSSDYW